MYRAFCIAATFLCINVLGCAGEEPAFNVNCNRDTAADGVSIECNNTEIIVGGPASPVDEVPAPCNPHIALAGTWVQDETGASSHGSFEMSPTGIAWRFMFILSGEREVTTVNVPVRPQFVPPTQPIKPAALALLRTEPGPVPAWSLIDETIDVTNVMGYHEARALTVGQGVEEWAEVGGLYEVRFQAPLDSAESSAIVVTGAPYLTALCPE
jgi:hypothetical protein